LAILKINREQKCRFFEAEKRIFNTDRYMYRYLSVAILAILLVSCAPKYYSAETPILEPKRELSRYNMEMTYGKNNMSGLLLFREDEKGEIIIHGSTLFGLTIFNFGIDGDDWKVYSCIEPLKDKRVQRLLENDFRKLFLPGGGGKNIESYPGGDGKGQRVVVVHKLFGVEMVFEEILD